VADEPTTKCSGCGEVKPRTVEFFRPDPRYKHGLTSRCRDCLRIYGRAWQAKWRKTPEGKKAKRDSTLRWERSEAGRPKHVAAKKAWKHKNRDKVARRQRELRAGETPGKKRKRIAAGVEYQRRRRARDPQFRMRLSVSSRISMALRIRGMSKRSRNWEKLVGYTLADLKRHIERQFVGRMSWANYGEWHVDHIVPVAAFCWRSPEDEGFRACWALSNLRPLWAGPNQSKKDRRLFLI
jgi:hypothetical protein